MKISELIQELVKQLSTHGDLEVRSCELQAGDDYSPRFTIPSFELGSKFEGKKDFLEDDLLHSGKVDFLVIE